MDIFLKETLKITEIKTKFENIKKILSNNYILNTNNKETPAIE